MVRTTLVGIAEVAELFGTTRQAASNWRVRHANFPSPTASLKSGPVWELPDIIAWAEEQGMAVKAAKAEAITTTQDRKAKCVTTSFVNMKGGVGKSTLTANLGWYIAYFKNKRVLLVDLDPQFNLSQYVLGNTKYERHLKKESPTVVDVFEEHTPGRTPGKQPSNAIIQVMKWEDGSLIHLVPSKLDLAWTLKNPHEKEHLLRDFLNEVKENYHLILIDCPPTESMLTTAAYLASDYLVVPMRPEFLSTIGLPLLVRSLNDHRNKYKNESGPELAGIIFNDSNGVKSEHRKSCSDVRKVAQKEGWHIFKKQISHSDSYPAGARVGKPIFLTDYARTTKKEELEAVGREFLAQINMRDDE